VRNLPPSVAALSDQDLRDLITLCQVEQRRRAIAGGDLEALAERSFELGFTRRGESKEPWLEGGLLICPGYRKGGGGRNYKCSFVSIDGTWVWLHEATAHDVVRSGRNHDVTTISIVAAWEGMEFDAVRISFKDGGRDFGGTKSYRVTDGKLDLVSTRQVRASDAIR